jgi:actin-like ATPase involved in cell morphogenesis
MHDPHAAPLCVPSTWQCSQSFRHHLQRHRIDLGREHLVYVRDKGIVLREPSVVASDHDTRVVVAVGMEAKKMLGRTPMTSRRCAPDEGRRVADFAITEACCATSWAGEHT